MTILQALGILAFIAACGAFAYTQLRRPNADAPTPHVLSVESELTAVAKLLLIQSIARSDADTALVLAARLLNKPQMDLPDTIKAALKQTYHDLALNAETARTEDLGGPPKPKPERIAPKLTVRSAFVPAAGDQSE